MAFLILVGFVLVLVVSVCVKMLKERPSKVTVQLLKEDDCITAKILEEVRSAKASAAAALAKARADLIVKLVQDCEASDGDTLLKGWTGLPLSGTLKQNARLTTLMAMSDEWEGLEVRVGKVTPMVDLAKELVDAYNAKKAKKSRRRMRSARKVPSSLVPEGYKRASRVPRAGHHRESRALNTPLVKKQVEQVEQVEEMVAVNVAVVVSVRFEEEDDVIVRVVEVRLEKQEGTIAPFVEVKLEEKEPVIVEVETKIVVAKVFGKGVVSQVQGVSGNKGQKRDDSKDLALVLFKRLEDDTKDLGFDVALRPGHGARGGPSREPRK
ncbi:hypothetical protein HKX48_006932 [Thoreauomyces humboldtii]|nr:hypothetical protein HKX48_006932 [Thoreauomyces humboldtii]